MNEQELKLLAATSKLANATSQTVAAQAETLDVLVQIVGEIIKTCPGFSDQQKSVVGGLLDQLRAAREASRSEGR